MWLLHVCQISEQSCTRSTTSHQYHYLANFPLNLSCSGAVGSGGEDLKVITESQIKRTEATRTRRAAACSDGCVGELLEPVTVGLSQISCTHTLHNTNSVHTYELTGPPAVALMQRHPWLSVTDMHTACLLWE